MSTNRRKRSGYANPIEEQRRVLLAQWVGLPLLAMITVFLMWQALNKC